MYLPDECIIHRQTHICHIHRRVSQVGRIQGLAGGLQRRAPRQAGQRMGMLERTLSALQGMEILSTRCNAAVIATAWAQRWALLTTAIGSPLGALGDIAAIAEGSTVCALWSSARSAF